MTVPSLLVVLAVAHACGALLTAPWLLLHGDKFIHRLGAPLVLLAVVWALAWELFLGVYIAGTLLLSRPERQEVRDGGRRW